MNRSILIVICDFLLISLLMFSSPEISKVSQDGAAQTANLKLEVSTNRVETSGNDLAAVMRLALEDEQKRRDLLIGELAATRQTASEREKQAQQYQQTIQAREQESARLQQQQTSLQQQFAAAQTNLQTLNQQLKSSSTDALISKEKLAQMEEELRQRAQEAAAFQKQLALLSKSNQMVLSERQQLAGQLQLAEVEKRHAAEQVVQMREQVQVERAEKAKLAEGVKALATKSTELTQEIRENRPLAPNAIFQEFLTNRVEAFIDASRPGFFTAESTRRKTTETILVSDGTNTFAVCHVEETPLRLWNPGAEWEKLSGSFVRSGIIVPIRSLSFNGRDPRIVFMPVNAADERKIGGKIYRISPTPFKFQDAVLIGANEDYYGECRFEIDTTTPGYVRLDRNVLKGLFGKFNPSRGDFVFSRNGDLLGIMANGTYCLMLGNFDSAATFEFGSDMRSQRTGTTLSHLYSNVLQMPLKLQ